MHDTLPRAYVFCAHTISIKTSGLCATSDGCDRLASGARGRRGTSAGRSVTAARAHREARAHSAPAPESFGRASAAGIQGGTGCRAPSDGGIQGGTGCRAPSDGGIRGGTGCRAPSDGHRLQMRSLARPSPLTRTAGMVTPGLDDSARPQSSDNGGGGERK